MESDSDKFGPNNDSLLARELPELVMSRTEEILMRWAEYRSLETQHHVQWESSSVEQHEILADYGQVLVEKEAKENEKQKSIRFNEIYRSSTDSQNGFSKPENTNETASPRQADASVVDIAAPDQQPVFGAEAVTRENSENLSFSIQQHDSSRREYISLGNVPPTSVATTVYNNYKLMLLSLGKKLLSSEVGELKDWAVQKFSIDNARNATNVLFELDRKGIINASDLSQLRNFFESIVRIDLVYIIDEFLLGNYKLLRQIPASLPSKCFILPSKCL
jgi:hypothetical protein